MKKIIRILSIFLIGITSLTAQNTKAVQMRNVWGNYANDTVLGTFDTYCNIQVQRYFKPAAIQPVIALYSAGTSVHRKFILEASNDGVNYVSVGTDTLILSSGILQKIWVLESATAEYYRIHALANYTAGTAAIDTLIMNGYVIGQNTVSNTNSVVKMLTTYGTTIDSVTNTGVNWVKTKVTRAFEKIAIQAVCTKKTGTQAGTVTLQGSLDGANWVTVNTGYLVNDITTAPFTTGGTATLTATNVAVSTKIFVVRGSPYQWYRLSWTGSGTMLSTLSGFLLGNN